MIKFTSGNLLESGAEALVNTVNTVGVMGKGIALMFKEAFPENFRAYEVACKAKEVRVGEMFVTERSQLVGPKWIVNFPTKQDWRKKSQLAWIESGLVDLRRFLIERHVRSVALPPLGSGNGGLDWYDVRPLVERILSDVPAEVIVFEPTDKYQNVAKRTGVAKLTAARALVAELVRRYGVVGIECTVLEVQKLAYFLERRIVGAGSHNPLDLRFEANKYGPYSDRLKHLLNGLDGSYLHCEKRLADAGPFDLIWFDPAKKERVSLFLKTEAASYVPALEETSALIDGFESPLSMELLATVDWLFHSMGIGADVSEIRDGLAHWPGGKGAGDRKLKLFDDRMLSLAIHRLAA